jgi:hypothetical protein
VTDGTECTNCGAQMTPGTDGRTHTCRYCGAHRQVAIDGHQIAAGMKLDLANADELLERLATELGSGFADLTRVESRAGRVVAFELALEPDVFIAKREARGLVVQHKRVVRGVALKTVTHPLDRWVELLLKALAAHANTSSRAAQVIERLRIG